jgi:hypothetical protein
MRRQGRDDSALEARSSSSSRARTPRSSVPHALATHLNAAVMQQQLGKSPSKCVTSGCCVLHQRGARCGRALGAISPLTRRHSLTLRAR